MSIRKKAVADYYSVRFWDDFYKAETEPFEWYHPYAMIRGIIRRFAAEDDLVIHLGCGNSRLCEDMVNDGYNNIMNIDFSPVVTEQVSTKKNIYFCVAFHSVCPCCPSC